MYIGRASIYALVDPRTRQIRYVGISHKVRARFNEHISEALRTDRNAYKLNWIRSVYKAGFKVGLRILEHDVKNPCKREQYWIRRLRAEGCMLTNKTDGGEGSRGFHFTHSKEVREKLRNARLGKKIGPPSEIHRKRLSKALRGRKLSEEHRKNIGLASLGRKPSEETRRKIGLKSRGNQSALGARWHHTKEAREKIRLSKLNQSPETRAKNSAANKGKKLSVKTRQLISKALTGYKQRPEVCVHRNAALRETAFRKHMDHVHMWMSL